MGGAERGGGRGGGTEEKEDVALAVEGPTGAEEMTAASWPTDPEDDDEGLDALSCAATPPALGEDV